MTTTITTFDQCNEYVQQHVADVFFQIWAAELGGDVKCSTTTLLKLRQLFDGKPNLLFVRGDGEALASVDTKSFTGCSPMIGNIYTSPDMRETGIGTAMLQYAEAHLRKSGFMLAYLWCYTELEPFYAKRGWYMIQKQVVNDRDAVVMAKNL
jgi:GNAT superfamily N-acetyltransferase